MYVVYLCMLALCCDNKWAIIGMFLYSHCLVLTTLKLVWCALWFSVRSFDVELRWDILSMYFYNFEISFITVTQFCPKLPCDVVFCYC